MSGPDSHHAQWHLDDATLASYVRGNASDPVAISAEAHLTACAPCRTRLAPAVPSTRLDAVWQEVDHRIDTADLPLVERLLVFSGLREDTARLLAATPSLGTSWLAAVTVAVVFAALAADISPDGLFVYLTLAPVLPVAGVAMAYGRLGDPAYELGVAAPYSMLRLLLLRALAVVVSTLGVTAFGGLVVADRGWQAAAWLLPSLALSLVTLAFSARVAPVWAGAGVITAWVTAVSLAWRLTDEELAAFGTIGQSAAALLLAAGAAGLVAQRHTFAFDSRRSA